MSGMPVWGKVMPSLAAQLEPHDAYVDLTVVGYSVWWRDEDGIKWSGRMPRGEVDQVVRHLNLSYYPTTFWHAPLYDWQRLLDAALQDPLERDLDME